MRHTTLAFADGRSGAALLLLRLSLAASLVAELGASRSLGGLFVFLIWGLAAALALGLYTRVAGPIVLGLAIIFACLAGWPPSTAALITALDAAAVSLLGPGALSIDGRRFGRRTVHLPR